MFKDIQPVLDLYQRRKKYVASLKPVCIICRTHQVQLVDYYNKEVKCRCRHCKHKFTIMCPE